MSKAGIILSICFTGLYAGSCFGQDMIPDSGNYTNAALTTINYFDTATGTQSEIYNGVVYTLAAPANRGTFYFQDNVSALPALVRYNGIYYRNVPVIYDEFADEMVSSLKGQLFVLIKANLSDIYLSGHHFVNYKGSDGSDLPAGYYDAIYNGNTRVLVKRTKVIEEHIIPPQTPETFYVDKISIYIKMAERYSQVNSKTDLLRLFQNHRIELEQYIYENKIDFRNDPENAAIKAAAYYDQLNK